MLQEEKKHENMRLLSCNSVFIVVSPFPVYMSNLKAILVHKLRMQMVDFAVIKVAEHFSS